MKVTVSISLQSNIKPLLSLMDFINFKEVDRVSTGGMYSSETLLITFEGDERDYDERIYIEEPQGSQWTRYYTIGDPNGTQYQTFEDFLTAMDTRLFGEYEVKIAPAGRKQTIEP